MEVLSIFEYQKIKCNVLKCTQIDTNSNEYSGVYVEKNVPCIAYGFFGIYIPETNFDFFVKRKINSIFRKGNLAICDGKKILSLIPNSINDLYIELIYS